MIFRNPIDPITSCPTNMHCADVMLRDEYGIKPSGFYVPQKGTVIFEGEGVDEGQIEFDGCSKCGLPSREEADRINSETGLKVYSVMDSVDKLKALKERLIRHEGRTR